MKPIKMLIVLSIIFTSISSYALSNFVHPLDFVNTESDRKKVVEQIKKQVNEKYNKFGIGNFEEIKAKQQEELDAFILLTGVESRRDLDASIKKACSPSMAISNCGYVQILNAYNEFSNKAKADLQWGATDGRWPL